MAGTERQMVTPWRATSRFQLMASFFRSAALTALRRRVCAITLPVARQVEGRDAARPILPLACRPPVMITVPYQQ